MKSKRSSSPRAATPASRGKAEKNKDQNNNALLIVGVGASAGGLQAFTALLRHLPRNPGMALVLVQHLAPQHASALTELLGRTAKMPVTEVTEGMRIEANHVYVIPPDRDMQVRQGELHLLPWTGPRPHMPIDHFFSSLAKDQGVKSIGVIFSGTASDGTLGLKAIKAAGGITFAQDPKRASHPEMPRNAIAAGCVDSVLPIEKIAKELLRIAHHPYLTLLPLDEGIEVPPKGESELRKVFRILRGSTGVDFTQYKANTLRRRIRRRMILLKLDTLKAYTQYLLEHRGEVDSLFQDVLIHVTGFLRDPEVFEALKTTVFPSFVKDRRAETPIRIWVAGCSTGEEVYSLAMALFEFLIQASATHEVQIFGTDVNNESLEKARQGEYLENIAAEVSPERLRRFFVRTPHGYRVSKALRDMCIFARHDIAKDPPFSRLDLISCRNLLIYLGPVLQKRILPIFHYALKPTGYLLLGASETIGSFANYFSLADKKHKLYTVKPTTRAPVLEFGGRPFFNAGLPEMHEPEGKGSDIDLQKEADRILLNRYSPPGAIINEDFQILHFRGRTGRYLEPAPGQASLNLAKMVREGLAVDLRAAVQEARKRGHTVRKSAIQMKRNSHMVEVDLDVVPIKGSRNLLVLFQDSPLTRPAESPKGAKGQRVSSALSKTANRENARLRDELAQSKSTLQSTIEELEATNEELRSANEEILSSNEELQSTNEELETAKEELQSANEELTTLNEELQNRNDELSTANNDFVNLLGNVNIPMLMLGSELRIRRFTPSVQKLMNVVPGDVGRSINDIKLRFELSGFEKLISDAIDNITIKEREVQDQDGRWYSMRIRPYKTAENRIEGAVISWVEITGMKEALNESTARYHFIFERNLAGIFYAHNGRVLDCNDAFARMLGYSSREDALKAENLDTHIVREDQKKLFEHLAQGKSLENEQIDIKQKDGTPGYLVISASLMEDGGTAGIAIDVTRRMQAERQLSGLSRSLMEEADKRRRQLARDLHDQVGSLLGGLIAMLGSLEYVRGLNKEAHNGIKKCLRVAHDCANEVRAVSHLQHPMVIDEMGLGAAVRWYANNFSKRAGIKVKTEIADSLGRMDEKVEIALYRVIQECLTNIQRHSKTKTATIRIILEGQKLIAEVQDFGKGFGKKHEGMGITGMRERMRELGGHLEIESGKVGTTVKAQLPLARTRSRSW